MDRQKGYARDFSNELPIPFVGISSPFQAFPPGGRCRFPKVMHNRVPKLTQMGVSRRASLLKSAVSEERWGKN
jgi:hypothetical protein